MAFDFARPSAACEDVKWPPGQKVSRLFVFGFKQDRAISAAANTLLDSVRYVSHEDSRPMSVTWTLDRPIPAKYLKKTSKLVAG